MRLYHICEQERWDSNLNKPYAPDSIRNEGFIHLSTKGQLFRTWKTYYRNMPGLVCLLIEIPEEDAELKFDYIPARDEELPHYYDELPKSYISDVRSIPEKEKDAEIFFTEL